MIIHTVCFSLRFDRDSTEETAFLDGARLTLSGIPGVEDFAVARQVSEKSDLNWQFSMRFADVEAYSAYNAHPDHVAFVESRWKADVEEFAEFDFVPWGADPS